MVGSVNGPTLYDPLGEGLLAVATALVWFAHIGLDRTLDCRLRYLSRFKDMHIRGGVKDERSPYGRDSLPEA